MKPLFWSGENKFLETKLKHISTQRNKNIDSKVIGNSFVISKADSLTLKDEFNQVKGNLMTVFIKNNEIKIAKVTGMLKPLLMQILKNAKTKN